MADGMELLRRDFLIDDLRAITAEAGVTGTIVVEAERTIEETAWLSRVAASSGLICGVVGWAPLTSPSVASELEHIASLPKVKAILHPVHDEADDQFVLRDDFNRGITALKRFDLRYDILILRNIFRRRFNLWIGIPTRSSSSITSPSHAFAIACFFPGRKTCESWRGDRMCTVRSPEW
jgi:predicted TIM-barrel fold metal-dependent hydrolase